MAQPRARKSRGSKRGDAFTSAARLLPVIEDNPRATQLELAAHAGLSLRQLRRALDDWIAAGVIEELGRPNRRSYRVDPGAPVTATGQATIGELLRLIRRSPLR